MQYVSVRCWCCLNRGADRKRWKKDIKQVKSSSIEAHRIPMNDNGNCQLAYAWAFTFCVQTVRSFSVLRHLVCTCILNCCTKTFSNKLYPIEFRYPGDESPHRPNRRDTNLQRCRRWHVVSSCLSDDDEVYSYEHFWSAGNKTKKSKTSRSKDVYKHCNCTWMTKLSTLSVLFKIYVDTASKSGTGFSEIGRKVESTVFWP